MKLIAWNVFISATTSEYRAIRIDTVWFTSECDEAYICASLRNHDNYAQNIFVQKA